MFTSFPVERTQESPPPLPPQGEEQNNPTPDAHSTTSSTYVFSSSQLSTQLHTYNNPAFMILVDVQVCPEPERDKDYEEWTVDCSPERPLASGHIVTLQSGDQEIGTWRISRVSALTRHWVTFRTAGGPHLRAPIPWTHLSYFEGYTHTMLYTVLSNYPPPHHSYAHKPTFQQLEVNPYEFEIPKRELPSLRIRLERNPKMKTLLALLRSKNTAEAAGSGEQARP
ncbi:hypothetical protein EVJ58_g10575 [Rhodofomes roseus]|uniref:Uncharacterized protein n=1 Tax=Rhodofomes roseus TaxID=34475 RepID=A0A4Y9XMV8_9APHY|nr:hypothetical protein EVJ58_g10575 [Rhodofomes roseus]